MADGTRLRDRLALPPESRIHPVFHVSLLKKTISRTAATSSTLPQRLVFWDAVDKTICSWEDEIFLQKLRRKIDPCGQGSENQGGIVMIQGKLKKMAEEIRAAKRKMKLGIELAKEEMMCEEEMEKTLTKADGVLSY